MTEQAVNIHIGLAETDNHMTPEMIDRLRTALDKAGVDYQAEVYPGTRHGWAVADTPVYQQEGAEHHWDRLLALFRATLQRGKAVRTGRRTTSAFGCRTDC